MTFPDERAFTDAVIDLLKVCNWRVMHMRGNTYRLIQGHAGYPDITAVKDRIIFAELKMPGGKLTEEQKAWQARLAPHHYVWYPANFGDIVEIATT